MNWQAKIDGLNAYIENKFPDQFEKLELKDENAFKYGIGRRFGGGKTNVTAVPGLLSEEQADLVNKVNSATVETMINLRLKDKNDRRRGLLFLIVVNFCTNTVKTWGYA